MRMQPGIAAEPRLRTLALRVSGAVRGGELDGDRRLVVGGAIGTAALNVGTLALNFVLTIVLSRLLGASEYGAYAFAFAWATVLSAFAGLGLSPFVIRVVSSSRALEQWGVLRGVIRWSNAVVLGSSTVVALGAALVGYVALGRDSPLLGPLLLGLLLVLLIPPTMVRQSVMQGLGRVVLGRLPETIVVPALFLAMAVLVGTLWSDEFDADSAVTLQIAATAAGLVLGLFLVARSIPNRVRSASPEVDRQVWRSSAAKLLLLTVAAASLPQIGTIALALIGDPEEAGIFAVCARVGTFTSFVMLAATYPLMPAVSRIHASRDLERLRALVIRSTRIILALTLPSAALLALLASPLLDLFGADFGEGTRTLQIYIVSELVKVSLGVFAIALLMSGHEGDLARATGLMAIVTTTVVFLLAPGLGTEGAALGYVVGSIAGSAFVARLASRRLGLSPGALLRRSGA